MARPRKRYSTATDYGGAADSAGPESNGDEEWDSREAPMTERVKRVRVGEEKNGWIRCIELQDFMCHRHLKVTLSSTINFITGNNGSGKSALLTALTVCLGGRASTTQRASSLASLVREGAETALVRVTLANAGEFNAFRPERYGDAIVIERRFGKHSGSANRYATFSAAGRLVSERREEVAQICDHFGIQVDNPLAVLSQETAKRFLASAKPRELYEFFLKATQLEQLAADHGYSLDRVTTAGQRIRAIRETWGGKEQRVAELEGLLQEVRRQKEIRQSLNEVKAQLAWQLIADKEAGVLAAERETGRRAEKLAGLEAAGAQIVARAASIQEEVAARQAEANALGVELEPVQRAHGELVRRLGEARAGKGRVEADAREANQAFKEETRNAERIQAALEDELRRAEGSEQQRIAADIAACGAAMQALNAEAAARRAEDGRLQERRAGAGEAVRRARDALQAAQEAYDRRRHQLEALRRAQHDRLLAFHDRMPAFMRELQGMASSFHRPPVGPIGLHVRLREAQWALPVESLVGKDLEAFIVKDGPDHDRLRALMARHGIRAPILTIGSEEPLDYQRHEPSSQYMTALRALDIQHPLVLKALIISAGIERAVMLPDRAAAKDVLRRRHADAAFTAHERVFVK